MRSGAELFPVLDLSQNFARTENRPEGAIVHVTGEGAGISFGIEQVLKSWTQQVIRVREQLFLILENIAL